MRRDLILAAAAVLAACGPQSGDLPASPGEPRSSYVTLGGPAAAASYTAPTRCTATRSVSTLYVQLSTPGAADACSMLTKCEAYAGATLLGITIQSFDRTGSPAVPAVTETLRSYTVGSTFASRGTNVSALAGSVGATCGAGLTTVRSGTVSVQLVGSQVVGSYSLVVAGQTTPLVGTFTAAICGPVAAACYVSSAVYPTTRCAGSLCCAAGTANCDGDQSNGCEARLESDPANCGACGHACGQDELCLSGVCRGCGDTLVDDGTVLCVPAGQTYTISGDRCYTGAVTVKGTLAVAPSGGAGQGGLTLRSPRMNVAATGRITADAAGNAGGLTAQTDGGHQGQGTAGACGGGPGACVGQGGSGGGYGGSGGTPLSTNTWAGPCERCDNPTISHCEGVPGGAYGTSSGPDFDLGSGGSAAGNSCGCTDSGGRGGAGGGAILLLAGSLQLDGTVSSAGEQPPADASTCGYRTSGGGGSGGAVVVRAASFAGAGNLLAPGGRGGPALGNYNSWGWAGGGGGGGRVKIYASSDAFTGLVAAAGGAGGATCGGDRCYAGEPGSAGTTYRSATIPPAWTTIGCGGF